VELCAVEPRQGDIAPEIEMAHTYTHLVVHALFSTRGRRPLLQAELRPKVFPYMAGIIKRLKGRPLLINGPNDHVHLLFVLPPTLPPFGPDGEGESQLIEGGAAAAPLDVRKACGFPASGPA
jgi:hypothetical protein